MAEYQSFNGFVKGLPLTTVCKDPPPPYGAIATDRLNPLRNMQANVRSNALACVPIRLADIGFATPTPLSCRRQGYPDASCGDAEAAAQWR